MGNYEVIENTWIKMSDGARLAAKIWLPENTENKPVPGILEYIPYRKRDLKAPGDHQLHSYFARRGYAGIRVDLRGSGESDGILRDEYLQQELNDGVEVIKWIASQKWCDGNVGMIGISWGGFNGLQIAAMQPPELKAIITVASSDDRYADDVHYMGGCLLSDNLSWASVMFANNSAPPDPEIVGDKWRSMWLDRLEGSGLWLKKWLEHQRRDDYWKHASVCEDYEAIQCPVMAVSGWADGYSNTVFRLLENLKVPRVGIVGAFGHKYPHMGGPGPTFDFLDKSVRWWDQWLKGIDNGVKDEPMLTTYILDSVSPLTSKRPGRWVDEKYWPGKKIQEEAIALDTFRIGHQDKPPTEQKVVSINSPLSVGLFAGKWCSYSESTDLPSDQREEDGGALVFETPVLEEDMEILGQVYLKLKIASDQRQGMVAVRLSDVAPDGRATRVTFGLLNLTHHKSHEEPEELEPGEPYEVKVPLNYIAQRFPAGHKMRISISSSYWPLAWPSPRPVTLTVYPSESTVVLPVRETKEKDVSERPLKEPGPLDKLDLTLLVPAQREWIVEHNLANNRVEQKITNNDQQFKLNHIDLEIRRDVTERYSYMNNDYNTVRGEIEGVREFRREGWNIKTITRTVLTSDKEHFYVRATLDAYENDVRVFARSFDERIPRDML
ncbi:MAG: CocE/NonD family hydrolase [Bacteroidales bacterium]